MRLAQARHLVEIAAIVLFAASQGLAQQAGGTTRSVAITDVTVVDVLTGELQRGVTVVTEGERIQAIARGASIPRSATRISGKGKFLIPGLWDMHAHHQGAGADWTDLFLAKGVVGTRDMGGDAEFILPLRDRVNTGAVLGPEIVTAGPMLDNAPGLPYRRQVVDAEQGRQAVADLKRLGVDFIKVHDHTPRDVFFAIAELAPKLGLSFSGHVPLAVKVEEAADAGIHSIEHLSNYQVFGECSTDDYVLADCRRLFEKLAARGVWQTPTFEFFQTAPDVFSGKPLAHAEYASDTLLDSTQRNVQNSRLSPQAIEKLRLVGGMALRAAHDMHSLGNRFLAGCDSLVPGFCLHDELEWFTKAGFTPLEALQTATINPARFLGREASQGSVSVGKHADLVLLNANPLTDIRNTTRIHAVLVRGKLLPKSDIDRILARHRRRLSR